jgi:signal peptidase II
VSKASDKKKADQAPPAAPPAARRSNQAIVLCVLAATALTAADLASKSWAEGALSHARLGDAPEVCAMDESGFVRYQRIPSDTIAMVDDVFELEYAENCGAAFGLLRQAPTIVRRVVFGIAAIAATCVLMWLFVRGRGGRYFAISVPLVISGAIGNFFDRFLYGYVVDFIHFHYEHPILWMDRFDYPTFNVADIAITIGVILLLIDGMRQDGSAKDQPKKEVDDDRDDDDGETDSESETESDSETETESETKREGEGPSAA